MKGCCECKAGGGFDRELFEFNLSNRDFKSKALGESCPFVGVDS